MTLGGAIFLTRANFKGFPVSRPTSIAVPDPSTPLSASDLTFGGRRSATPSQYGGEAVVVTGNPLKRPRPDFSADVDMWVQASSCSPTSQPAPPGSSSPTTLAGFIELFFSLFHPAHPFVLPRSFLLRQLKQRRLGHLLSVIQYIGSCYAQTGQTEACREAANQSLLNSQIRKDGFSVQALLLFAIGLHSCGERERAVQVLAMAIDMALELGMNRQEFSSNNGEGCRVLEESWRRTWWELYVIDGLVAAIHQKNSFRLYNIPTDVPLPCEEVDYFVTGVSR
jgi:Fungal specific transcription factor domain